MRQCHHGKYGGRNIPLPPAAAAPSFSVAASAVRKKAIQYNSRFAAIISQISRTLCVRQCGLAAPRRRRRNLAVQYNAKFLLRKNRALRGNAASPRCLRLLYQPEAAKTRKIPPIAKISGKTGKSGRRQKRLPLRDQQRISPSPGRRSPRQSSPASSRCPRPSRTAQRS